MSDINLFQQALGTAAASSGVRNTALLLHSVGPNDRDWLLSQIDATRRAEIRTMLDELTVVGMPADPAIVGAALSSPASGETATMGSPIGREAALRVLSGDTVCHVLACEPDRLIAALLHRRDWPWQESLLQQVGPVRRQRILGVLRGSAGNAWPSRRTRFEEALLQGILARAAHTVHTASVKPTEPRFRKFAAYMQRCIRLAAARVRLRAHS